MLKRSTTWFALPIAAIACLSTAARAEQGPAADAQAKTKVAEAFRSTQAPAARSTVGPDQWPAAVKAIFVGVTGGVGFANVKHPQIGTAHVLGPMLSFQLGYRITERWALSLVYTDFQQSVSRASGDELFASSSNFLHTAADCTNCKPALPGGNILATTFHLATIGPAVDVTPFGKNGPFIGGSAGLTMASVLGTRYGAAGTARAGLRLRPFDNLGLGIEGGIQGESFSGGSAMIGYTSAEVRLSF